VVKSRGEQIEDLKKSARIPTSFDKTEPPSRNVSDQLENNGREVYDLLVIGGGATGTGIALDAVTRGLKVALVERDDFASGTSSKSTKLVHGGVRYLEKAVWELDYNQ
jgi:glycerol-3-phosphate dehydrogenase